MKNLALVTSFFFMTLAVALPGGVKPPICPSASAVTVTIDKPVTTTLTTTENAKVTMSTTTTVSFTKEETTTTTVTKSCSTRTREPKPTETCPHPHNWNKGLGHNSECSDSCSHRETGKNGETITCRPAGPGCKKHCLKCKKHPKCHGASDGDACDEDGYCQSGECIWLVNKKKCGE